MYVLLINLISAKSLLLLAILTGVEKLIFIIILSQVSFWLKFHEIESGTQTLTYTLPGLNDPFQVCLLATARLQKVRINRGLSNKEVITANLYKNFMHVIQYLTLKAIFLKNTWQSHMAPKFCTILPCFFQLLGRAKVCKFLVPCGFAKYLIL